jgi:choline dehydrogenase
MLYVRGNPHDYDHWQALGNPGWSYQVVLSYFKKLEHRQHSTFEYEGVKGELSVTDIASPAVTSQRFVDAAVALGYDYNPDIQWQSTRR